MKRPEASPPPREGRRRAPSPLETAGPRGRTEETLRGAGRSRKAGAAAAAADAAAPAVSAPGRQRTATLHAHGGGTANCGCWSAVATLFYAALGLWAAAAAVLYGLRPSNRLRKEAQRLVELLLSFSGPSKPFHFTSYLRDAAEQLRHWRLLTLSKAVETLADWQYVEPTAALLAVCFSVFLVVALVRLMVDYKRNRDVEVTPPAVAFCQNRMSLDEYRDKSATYSAVAQLMGSPEFKALKVKRAAEGSEAWNWQKRGEPLDPALLPLSEQSNDGEEGYDTDENSERFDSQED